MARGLNRASATRRAGATALALAVGAVHVALMLVVADSLAGFGDATRAPKRLQAAFVRELLPEPPPAAAAEAPRKSRPKRKRKPAEPALATAAAASEPALEPTTVATGDVVPLDPPPPPEAAASAVTEVPAAHASAPVASQAASAPETAFEWPASTRLSYTLSGYYRGAVHGSAEVRWVHSGERYQVQMDVSVGLDIAPLATRRITSDGVVGAEGLSPRRFDEETRRAFGEPRRNTITFEPGQVVLANGERHAVTPGVQDAASQFVQLTWMFTLQPKRLAAGNTIEFLLALPRSLDRWTYDVIGETTLHPPFGPLQAVHVKPRREPRAGGDLVAEMWIAPALQYLPVRIVVRQDAETYVDLMIDRPPLQAEREAPHPDPLPRAASEQVNPAARGSAR